MLETACNNNKNDRNEERGRRIPSHGDVNTCSQEPIAQKVIRDVEDLHGTNDHLDIKDIYKHTHARAHTHTHTPAK